MPCCTQRMGLLLCLLASATPVAHGASDESAAKVALAAGRLQGGVGIDAALRTVKVSNWGASQALVALGFGSALDLQLLGGGPEAKELMDELRTRGALNIADRAKIRLLINDRVHRASFDSDRARGMDAGKPFEVTRRRLQSSAGPSADSIAIVISVMVGAAGYLVQAYTARRAQRAAAEVSHEQQAADAAKERLHQQVSSCMLVILAVY